MKRNNLMLILIFVVLGGNAYAHKLNIFARHKGDKIVGYCYYPDGNRATGLTIKLIKNDKQLMTTNNDKQGAFTFNIKKSGNFKIIAQSVDGHCGEFKIKVGKIGEIHTVHSDTKVKDIALTVSNETIVDLTDRIENLENRFTKQEDKLYIKDIIGVCGLIFGLFGIWAYFIACKKIKEKDEDI